MCNYNDNNNNNNNDNSNTLVIEITSNHSNEFHLKNHKNNAIIYHCFS
jgi:Tfp pilus assembly protein FimT